MNAMLRTVPAGTPSPEGNAMSRYLAPSQRVYPIPPHAQDTRPFDEGIFRRPVAPGTQGLGFDNNGMTEEEWFHLVYPALVGRQRIDL